MTTHIKEAFLRMALYLQQAVPRVRRHGRKLVSTEKYKQSVDLYRGAGDATSRPASCRSQVGVRAATQVSPGNPRGLDTASRRSRWKETTSGARKCRWRKALHSTSASAEPQILLGYIRLRQKRLNPKPCRTSRKASALNADDTVSLCMVGYTYEKSGHTRSCDQCYARR